MNQIELTNEQYKQKYLKYKKKYLDLKEELEGVKKKTSIFLNGYLELLKKKKIY